MQSTPGIKVLILGLILFIDHGTTYVQEVLVLPRLRREIRLDGIIDESVWQLI